MLKHALAVSRAKFKEEVEGYLSGALREYVKAEVAEANGYTRYLDHWRGEVERLIWFELWALISQQTLKTNFDRRKAVEEVIQEYQKDFPRLLESARTSLAVGYFHDKKRKSDFKLPDIQISASAFWVMVFEMLDDAIEECSV